MKYCCPICGEETESLICQRNSVPVFQNKVFQVRDEAVSINRADMEIYCCNNCGFAFNALFDEELVEYDDNYNNSRTFSKEFKKYTAHLVDYLNDKGLIRDKKIIEVGCGKGDFLRELSRSGAACLVGFDPAYESNEYEHENHIKIYKEYYGANHIDLEADVVICRHVIEHIVDPLPFLKNIRATLQTEENRMVFFETPDVRWILEHCMVYDFVYEHCSYFSEDSITVLFNKAGFEIEEICHEFSGQYLWILAKPSQKKFCNEKKSDVVELGCKYHKCEKELINRWKQTVADSSKEIAIWGASAKGVLFVNLFDPRREYIKYVIDINTYKQRKFLPGTGHMVIPPEKLSETEITDIIIMNDNYAAEIKEFLADNNIRVNLIESNQK